MVMSEIKDLNSSREVADLGGSGREFHRRMVSGDRGTEKLLGCLEEAEGTRPSVGAWTRLFLIL